MLSQIPIDLRKVKKENLNKEILRAGLIAELDAINLYEQLAALADDDIIKEVSGMDYYIEINRSRYRSKVRTLSFPPYNAKVAQLVEQYPN